MACPLWIAGCQEVGAEEKHALGPRQAARPSSEGLFRYFPSSHLMLRFGDSVLCCMLVCVRLKKRVMMDRLP